MRTLHATVAALALAGMTACTSLPISRPPTNGGSTTTSTSGGSAVAADIVTYTNDARTRNGLRPLASDSRLMEAARIQAQQMATYQLASHTISNAPYPTMESRLAAAGYAYSMAAENIAWNQQGAQEAVNSWMNSSGHRANILDPNFTHMGAAMARSSRGEPYWVQVFGKPR